MIFVSGHNPWNFLSTAVYVSDTLETNILSPFEHIDHPPSPISTDGWGDIDENGVKEEESDKDGWDDIDSYIMKA